MALKFWVSAKESINDQNGLLDPKSSPEELQLPP